MLYCPSSMFNIVMVLLIQTTHLYSFLMINNDYKKDHIREFPGQVKKTMERIKWLRPDHDWIIICFNFNLLWVGSVYN